VQAPRIDLYSDTKTRPTPAMRRAMAEAEVGDEQAHEDPTTLELERLVAELLGKEAALFLPSGTMCNEIAYRVHCQPGDEIILDATAHGLHFEAGGPAALAGAMLRPVPGRRGVFTAEQLLEAVRPPDRHQPVSRLVSIENTSNMGGGTVWPIETVRAVTEAARERGLATHMDGARLFNAVVASGVGAETYAAPFESLWIDLSKGLGAPVGAVLAGSQAFIDRAWRFKQQFGGAMRQSGVIAAAGLYALEHHIERLAEDHANAKRFAEAIAGLPGLRLDADAVETNMVFFGVEHPALDAEALERRLLERGVRIGASGPRQMRAVTHLDVSRADAEEAAEALRLVIRDS